MLATIIIKPNRIGILTAHLDTVFSEPNIAGKCTTLEQTTSECCGTEIYGLAIGRYICSKICCCQIAIYQMFLAQFHGSDSDLISYY